MFEMLIAHASSLAPREGVVLLNQAQRAYDRGKPCQAIKFLELFQRSVRKRSGRSLAEADAAALIAEAGNIIDLLEEKYRECS